ncbi:MAG: hypothetical protein ACU843_05650 [Gammaproteobacteria bacterium]
MPLSREPPKTLIRAAIVRLAWFAALGSVAAGPTAPPLKRNRYRVPLYGLIE